MFNIIPQPVSIFINQDKKGFTLHAGTTISPYPFVDEFISFVRKTLNKKVYVQEDTGEERSIILKLDDTVEHNEGYRIKCENRRVFINAKTAFDIFSTTSSTIVIGLETENPFDNEIYKLSIVHYYETSKAKLPARAIHVLEENFKSILGVACLYFEGVDIGKLKNCGKKTYDDLSPFITNLYVYISSLFTMIGKSNEMFKLYTMLPSSS